MPKHAHVRIRGKIAEVFFHRFVVDSDHGKVLADVGPEVIEEGEVKLKAGKSVVIEGEQKPSEIKVHRITVGDKDPVETQHGRKHHDDHDDHKRMSLERATKLAHDEGFEIVGELVAKKKHYEAEAMRNGRRYEIHIHRDGVHIH
ncbi:MAG: hypothetical protein JSS20_04080 [Proteobacteria bacterium]|nr:hypothetical protein [Pseudomonadota bacterium]